MDSNNIKHLLSFSIINLDKPTGPTSYSVSNFVRNIFKINKTSHFGTLDPQVTGVLPVALGRACRLNDYFMHRNKTYVGIMRLHKEITKEELEKVVSKFIGKIKQLPPVRSRVKRAIREREIVSFNILEISGKDVLFETEVQAGTYIRKLCDDIGKETGGAHMLELRRTKAGMFTELDKNFVNLYDLESAIEEYSKGKEEKLISILIPAEEAIKKVLPFIEIDKKKTKTLLTGKPLMKSDVKEIPKNDKFAIFSEGFLIGVYRSVSEGDIIARPEFVLN